jgi:hypothetical protein
MSLMIFKLEKFTIEGYDTKDRDSTPTKFEAQFNPTSIYWNYKIAYNKKQSINASGQQQDYEFTQAPQLSVTLTIDGTNVDSIGGWAPFAPSVNARIKKFKETAYDYRGTAHEPPYLTVSWGTLERFNCRLCSFKVTYTLFDRDATPLRAEIAAKFVHDISADEMAQEQKKESPDLTHSRVVRVGDTLPLLTRDVYGSSQCYLDVARYNGLDNFRSLTPGQELLFPPLVVFASSGTENSNAERGGK